MVAYRTLNANLQLPLYSVILETKYVMLSNNSNLYKVGLLTYL